jgi:flavin-dependent dehydrogenase
MGSDSFDIVILGAGPAGASAALFAARAGLKAAVCEREPEAAGPVRLEWLHSSGRQLLSAAGVREREATVGRIRHVHFVEAAGKREVRVGLEEASDLVDVSGLTKGVIAAARKSGAVFHFDCRIDRVESGEQCVRLEGGDAEIQGRVLIAADGVTSTVLASQSRESPAASAQWCVESASGPASAAGGKAGDLEIGFALHAGDPFKYGYACRNDAVSLAGGVAATQSGADAERSVACERFGTSAKPGKKAREPAPAARRIPRGLAMDLDTHVLKRSLIIGDAGGYVTALSHEGLYPAIWSARLAVDVCKAALASAHVQDGLAEFDTLWRREMVDYLRLPNNDLRFLIPLVFSNKLMAAKLAHAFIGGRNI